MLRIVTLALALLTTFAAPLQAQAPAPEIARAARARSCGPARGAQDHGRKLGVLQRRPRENLHHHVPQRCDQGGQEGRVRCGLRWAFPVSRRSRDGAPATTTSSAWSTPGDPVLDQRGGKRHLRSAAPWRRHSVIQNASGRSARLPRTAADMTGNWQIVRRTGRPICSLALTNIAAGEEFVIRVQPPWSRSSRASRRRRGRWDRGELVLRSANGQSWRFEETEGKWQRVPETSDPVLMVRSRMLVSGREKLERMRDGRAVYIGAERVDDVTTHRHSPRARGHRRAIRSQGRS